MSKPLVSIIVVYYNGREVLESCLQSIFSSSYSPLEVIIVKNSSDGDSEMIEITKKFDVVLIKKKINVGFCAACNEGARKARGKYILFLNYDTILERETISKLVDEALKTEWAGFYQPKILMLDNNSIINSTGIIIHIAGFGCLRGAGEIDIRQYDNIREITAVHGACLFASKEALQDVGYFDDFFFAFNEDTDLGWRALLRGWRPRYVPAVVYHKWGYSWGTAALVNSKLYYVERNRLIMILTNYELRTLTVLLPILFLAEVSTFVYCLARRLIGAKIKAYADILRMRRYILKRRAWVQSKRKLSDAQIINRFSYEFKHPFLAKPIKPFNTLTKLYYRLFFREVRSF
jgi:GT2 family glycosyltransferase